MNPEQYRSLRERIGTQKEVSEVLGVHRSVVAKRETGKVPISHEAATAIASLASVSAILRMSLDHEELPQQIPVQKSVPNRGKSDRIPVPEPDNSAASEEEMTLAEALEILGAKGEISTRAEVKSLGKVAQREADPRQSPTGDPARLSRVNRAYSVALTHFSTIEEDET